MEINILIKKVEKKICDKIKCEKIIIEDKTFLHKKHKNFDSKKFHLKMHPICRIRVNLKMVKKKKFKGKKN